MKLRSIIFILVTSCLFLTHLFLLEKIRSGFIAYDRMFYLIISSTLFIIILVQLLLKDWLGIKISKSAGCLLLLPIYFSLQLFITDHLSIELLLASWLIPFTYLFFQQAIVCSEKNVVMLFLMCNCLVAILYILQIQVFAGFSVMKIYTQPNPGANVNYFVSLIPISIAISCSDYGNKFKELKILALITVILVSIIVFQSHSRLAYVAITVGLGFYFYKISNKNKKLIKGIWKPLLIGLSSLIVLYGLYSINKESVIGRFLIYKISFEIFKNHPFTGSGLGGFEAVYNHYQAAYFRDNSLPIALQFLAGDTFEPFNEIIRGLVELGVIGMSIAGFIIYYLYKIINKQEGISKLQYGALASLISTLVCALLSYPLSFISIIINVMFFFAILTSNERNSLFNSQNKVYLKLLVFTLFTVYSLLLCKKEIDKMESSFYWEQAAQRALEGDFKEAKKDYNLAYKALNYDGRFLTNLGAEMIIGGEPYNGIKYLEDAKQFYPSTTLYIYLGDGYIDVKQLSNAERAYRMAIEIAPSRFSAKYKLLNLYILTKNYSKVKNLALHIINYPIKIQSPEVLQIKEFAKKVFQSKN